MKSLNRVAFLVGLYLCSVLIVAVPAQAQIPAAAVSMNCSPGEVRVEVKPGSSYSGYTTCTVTNPTTYIEKVNIQDLNWLKKQEGKDIEQEQRASGGLRISHGEVKHARQYAQELTAVRNA